MDLRTLTYTSLAALDLTADDLEAIHRSALEHNAMDGITGLLIFNGTHFLQIVEGVPSAIDELLERLRRDRRHTGLEVRDDRMVSERSFGEWSMELVRVSASYFEARETVGNHLPADVSEPVRDRVIKMTETISGNVAF